MEWRLSCNESIPCYNALTQRNRAVYHCYPPSYTSAIAINGTKTHKRRATQISNAATIIIASHIASNGAIDDHECPPIGNAATIMASRIVSNGAIGDHECSAYIIRYPAPTI